MLWYHIQSFSIFYTIVDNGLWIFQAMIRVWFLFSWEKVFFFFDTQVGLLSIFEDTQYTNNVYAYFYCITYEAYHQSSCLNFWYREPICVVNFFFFWIKCLVLHIEHFVWVLIYVGFSFTKNENLFYGLVVCIRCIYNKNAKIIKFTVTNVDSIIASNFRSSEFHNFPLCIDSPVTKKTLKISSSKH